MEWSLARPSSYRLVAAPLVVGELSLRTATQCFKMGTVLADEGTRRLIGEAGIVPLE